MSVVDRVYANALFEAAQEQGRLEPVARAAGASSSRPSARCPSCASCCATRSSTRARAAPRSRTCWAAPRSCCATSCSSWPTRAAPAQLEEIAREFERLVAEDEGIVHAELTTAVELSDDEARRSCSQQIEQASGRKVEATRAVDPDLIGGIVLQVGSHRLDASVRGRLDRLRRQLVTQPREEIS